MVEALIDRFGDDLALAACGMFVGILFGAMAQHSRFCLRAASVEVAEGNLGPRLSVWLTVFFAALTGVQSLVALGVLDVSQARQLAATGSLSGAIVGGLMFGCGMILARGCASRLLVLSATGNLRAIVTGLVLTLVAQSALRGVLSPAREAISGLWLVSGGETRNLLTAAGISAAGAATLSGIALAASLGFALHRRVALTHAAAAVCVGVAVVLGWLATFVLAQASLEVIDISSITLTGPSTDTLMGLVNNAALLLNFGVGLVPGVVLGAACMALATGEARIERFGPETPMERYLIGAALMGFGAMLAGGCAVGAGLSGGAVFSLTAWVAVFFMWVGAVITQRVLALVPYAAAI